MIDKCQSKLYDQQLSAWSIFNAQGWSNLSARQQSVEYYFVAVVFLTDEENEIRRNRGHDALMDYWTEIDKDLIGFGIKQQTNGRP